MYGLSFHLFDDGCAMSEQSSGLTSNRKADSAPASQNPSSAEPLSAGKLKANPRRKMLLAGRGCSNPGWRALVRDSVGPDNSQYGFNR
jgi:hypothetical protein